MSMTSWSQRSLKWMVGLSLLATWAGAAPISLEGTRNTRDLGGMPVGGGRLRDGQLIRSGALCFLTPDDAGRLGSLQARTVIDVRTAAEIEKDGKDRYTEGARNLWLPITSYHGRGAESYRSILLQNPRAIRSFFATLADPQAYPVIYHCSAGKDRTGVLTALLLDVLATPRERIMDDYMQSRSNSTRLWVEREWLQEVFDAVDRVGGSARFLEIQGVPAGDLESIRKILVVSPP